MSEDGFWIGDNVGESLKNYVLNLFVGKGLGKGAYRKVFALAGDDTKVLKVETHGTDFCNVMEKRVWDEVEGTCLEKWFAPVHDLDAMGVAMIQTRTKPFEYKHEFDEAVEKFGPLPGFFDDVHWGNWGMLDDRLVCHDYAFNHFLTWGVKGAAAAQEAADDKQMELPL